MSKGRTTVSRTHSRTAQDAVPRALGLAEAAAKRGEYAEALAWLETVEANGGHLGPKYEYKRARWRLRVKGDRNRSSQWFG